LGRGRQLACPTPKKALAHRREHFANRYLQAAHHLEAAHRSFSVGQITANAASVYDTLWRCQEKHPSRHLVRICLTAADTSWPCALSDRLLMCFIATPVAWPSFFALTISARTGSSALMMASVSSDCGNSDFRKAISCSRTAARGSSPRWCDLSWVNVSV